MNFTSVRVTHCRTWMKITNSYVPRLCSMQTFRRNQVSPSNTQQLLTWYRSFHSILNPITSSSSYPVPCSNQYTKKSSFSSEKDPKSALLGALTIEKSSFSDLGGILAKIGKTKSNWKSMDASVQLQLKRKFITGCSEPNVVTLADFSSYLLGFSNLGFEWNSDSEIRDIVFKTTQTLLSKKKSFSNSDARYFANTLSEFGKNGMEWKKMPHAVCEVLLNGIVQVSKNCDNYNVSNIFHGLGQMGVQWNLLPQNIRTALETMFIKQSMKLNHIHLSAWLVGCLKLKYRWFENDNSDVKNKFYDQVINIYGQEVIKPEAARGLANVIHGIAKTGMTKQQIRPAVIHVLLKALNECGGNFNQQELSNCIYGLGEIGLVWQEIPSNVKQTLEKALVNRLKDFEDIGLSSFLIGSSKMGYQWSDNDLIRPEVFRALERSLAVDRVGVDPSRKVTSIIYGMGKGGFNQKDLPTDFMKKISEGLIRSISSLNAQAISNIIWGFGKMEIQWKDIQPEVKKSIEIVLKKEIPSFTSITLSGFIIGSAGMNYPWYKDLEMKLLIFKNILEVFAVDKLIVEHGRNIANILYGMGKNGMKKEDIPSDVLHVLLSGIGRCSANLNVQELSFVIFGLGEMGVQWMDIPLQVRNWIEEEICRQGRELSRVNLAGFVKGSSGMKYQWFKNRNIQTILFGRMMKEFGPDEIALESGKNLVTLIAGLGKSGLKEDHLPAGVLKIVFDGLISCRSYFNQQDQAMITVLTGLGEMGVHWANFPMELKTIIEAILMNNPKDQLQKDGIIKMMITFHRLQYQWFHNNSKIKEEIFQKSIQFFNDHQPDNKQGFVDLIYVMASIGLKKHDLSKELFLALLTGLKYYQTSLSKEQVNLLSLW